MTKKYLAVAGLLVLSACATSPSVSSKVDAVVVGLTTAEQAALIYTQLPRCPVGAPICSDPVKVQQIKDYDNKAYAAVKAAEQNEALLSVALDAVSSLTAVIPATK